MRNICSILSDQAECRVTQIGLGQKGQGRIPSQLLPRIIRAACLLSLWAPLTNTSPPRDHIVLAIFRHTLPDYLARSKLTVSCSSNQDARDRACQPPWTGYQNNMRAPRLCVFVKTATMLTSLSPTGSPSSRPVRTLSE
jgi:hypothetical protein